MHGLPDLPLWTLAPFGALLLAIGALPLAAPHFWESNRHKALVSGGLALPVALYLGVVHGAAGIAELGHKGVEYASFIALLGALYVTCGGVLIRGSLSGTPLANSALLAVGGVLASAIGTTGASMLLIRPLLRANERRRRKTHIVVFFIFIVSNCGGLLTPLGDPPLLLGYLKGVPFEWTLRFWPEWLFVNGLLLVAFNLFDQFVIDREELEGRGPLLEEVQHHAPLGITGGRNLILLGTIVLVVFASGRGLWNRGEPWPFGIAEACLVALAAASWWTTPRQIHAANGYSWHPITEVAVLFAGIFVTMAPALVYLNRHAPGLGLEEPWQIFWATGLLSSVLDNAPTYLTFAATACGLAGVPLEGRYLGAYLAQGGGNAETLAAISLGAVFMGANSYIGNGPNFMVKAIAERAGVPMPSFLGYMGYAAAILLPLFALVTWIFLL